jgi:hypothetical protein
MDIIENFPLNTLYRCDNRKICSSHKLLLGSSSSDALVGQFNAKKGCEILKYE